MSSLFACRRRLAKSLAILEGKTVARKKEGSGRTIIADTVVPALCTAINKKVIFHYTNTRSPGNRPRPVLLKFRTCMVDPWVLVPPQPPDERITGDKFHSMFDV
jgi:hypothetical protein